MKNLNDIELLDQYASQRSEEAFRELVARHVDLIYSSAMRQLQNPHLAQEATQTAFIALAGKAGQLRRQTIIAGWLHRAVHFAALKLQRSEARRKHWEEEAATMNAPGEAAQDFQEHALPHVDGALAELSEGDRDAVILRFLHQRSLRDVAGALGTSEEAAKKRVSRALEKLRGLLARRGVTVPATVLAVGLSQMPVTAAPAALPATLAALAVKVVVPTLTTSAATITLMTYIKILFAVAAALIILAGSAAMVWHFHFRNTFPMAANINEPVAMKIKLTSVMVNDQDKALKFYTEVLGFVKKRDVPAGAGRWLTVVSPEEPDGTELVLEPTGFPAAKPYQTALHEAGIPLTSFAVDDIQRTYERLKKLGVAFSMEPTVMGPTTVAAFDDTCGNVIQLFQPAASGKTTAASAIRIKLTSVMVSDQEKALKFYTEVLGFVKKKDMPAGAGRWLTVVSPDEFEGTELLLEPTGFPPSKPFQSALHTAGIPLTAFAVDDIQKAYKSMKKLGVTFTGKPTAMGPTTVAIFDDTCGNLIQMFEKK